MVGRFKIYGNLRFLSHAETVRLMCRALIRSGTALRYSEGFNPRPKLSLPLPRSVGVAADNDLFCVSILCPDDKDRDISVKLKSDISKQLPADCELISVESFDGKVSPKAVSAKYYFPIEAEIMNEAFQTDVEDLNQQIAGNKDITILRRIDAKGRTRQVNIGAFLESIELDEYGITAKCMISNAGTIRPGEVLELLKLDHSVLTGPIRRHSVQWKMN